MFELDAYCVNGHAAHANASGARRARGPPKPAADERQAEQRDQVEQDRREVHRRQRVPLVAPAEEQVARDVREVRDRPVGVAERVRGLAAGRSSARGRAPRRSLSAGPHFFRSSSLREVAVRALAVPDAVGADHARVADVDHVRRADVEPDAETRRGTPSPRRAARPARPARRAAAGRRARSRGSGRAIHRSGGYASGIAAKMWPWLKNHSETESDSEREQVERCEPTAPPPVDEPEQEERAEREPDAGSC